MDAPGLVERITWPAIESPTLARLLRTLIVSWLALVALGAIVLVLRRASGALTQPLPSLALAACGLLLALAALAFRGLVGGPLPGRPRWMYVAQWLIPSAVLLLWGGSLSLEGSSATGLVAFWGVVLAEEGWSWGRLWRAEPGLDLLAPVPKGIVAGVCDPVIAGTAPASQRPATLRGPDPSSLNRQATASREAAIETAAEVDAGVTQQLIRRRQADLSESLEGWLRADLAAGQRHATAHIAICPPLDAVPQCFAEQMDGPSATIKVAQVLPYGVRFEIRLDQPAREAVSVLLEFSIQQQPSES